MRLTRFVCLLGLLAVARAQPPSANERLRDTEHDDADARALYSRNAGFSISESSAKTMNDEGICNLIDEHGELGWLEEYAPHRSEVLGKDGITAESARTLGAKLGTQLAYALLARLEKDRPIKIPCGFGHCHGGMCGDGLYLVAKSYQLADRLQWLMNQYKLPMNPSLIEGYWMQNVSDWRVKRS